MIKEALNGLRETVDELVGIYSPEALRNRVALRYQSEIMKRDYEAASKGRMTQGWRANRKHPSTEASVNSTVEDRARDLIRNDGFAKRGRHVLQTYTIGTGLVAAVRDKTGKKDDEMTKIFNDWAKSIKCDSRRRNNFYGIQSLVMREIVTSGEVLILKQTPPREKNESTGEKKIPLNLLVVEASYLDEKKDDGVSLIAGVQYQGQTPTGYWIKNSTVPGSKGEAESKLTPYEGVIHIYEEERPGQTRGVSWFAPVVTNLRDLDLYRAAELMRRKVASCLTGFVTSNDATFEESAKESFAKLEPGAIEFLSPGQDIKFSNPPSTSDYGPYMQIELQKIAAGLGITYEHLSQNLREVNFSSARVGQIPFQKFVREWQTQLIVPQFLDRVFDWFKEAAILVHGTKWADVTVDWSLPRVEMLDEEKETNAVVTKVRAGLQSQSEAIRTLGGDPERVYAEINADNDTLDALGIIADTDPRKTTKAGIAQTSYQETGGNKVEE